MSVETVTLGSSSVAVAPLGIGTWAWGDNLFWGYGKDYSQAELRAAFHAAVELGVNFFDTAEIYGFGESERLLGQFMTETDRPVQIASKFMPLPWRFSTQSVTDALSASLHRLQKPSIALYQVHQPFDFFVGQKNLINTLADEVEQGRIQAVGVSNYSAEQMRQAHQYLADRGIPLAVNQMQYSLLARQIETNGVLSTARELNITILAYSPLAQGLLTGKYTAENYTAPIGARSLNPRFSRSGLEKLAPLLQQLKEIGEQYGKTPAQVALNWLMAQGNVIPIPGAKNAEQVRQNAGALGWSLSPEEVSKLRAAAE
ncbi:2,5-didehydrogluconate reductase [filamentous cyanobacterium CCP1]|nr:2,5-didehydrogluconate reductase [filamentous cyanobacterium CCP2]PSB55045.1 2,5-didehydrogluconate reductase [filamentous cyanobacterium CCP1]